MPFWVLCDMGVVEFLLGAMDTLFLAVLTFFTMIPVGALALPIVMNLPGPKANTVYRIPQDNPSKAKMGLAVFLFLAFAMSVIVAHSLVTGTAPCPSRRCNTDFHREASVMFWPAIACLYAGGTLMASLAYYWFRYLQKSNRT